MEGNLSQVGRVPGHLKHKALDMANEIESPDLQIEQTTEKADANKDSIEFAKSRARKLIDV